MDSAQARNRMVEAQIARRGVRDAAVLAAMRAVPREAFISPGFEEFAYEDSPLPIAEGQTISQPYIVGAMLAAAELEGSDKVLEVGTGSGYATAVISRIAAKVFAIERHAALTDAARERLRALGYDNVELTTGDGSAGWSDQAPFDAIIVSAGVPRIPQALKTQLAIGGRLVIPVGPVNEQRLVRLTRSAKATFGQDDLGGVRFVKLIGAGGWAEMAPPPGKQAGAVGALRKIGGFRQQDEAVGVTAIHPTGGTSMTTASGHTSAILASKVKGTTVYNETGDKIGTVEDIVLDKQSNQILFAALGFGGVLGMGEKYYPVPWSLLEYDADKGGYVVPLNKDLLEKAPAYSLKDLTKHDGSLGSIREQTYTYYHVSPDWQ